MHAYNLMALFYFANYPLKTEQSQNYKFLRNTRKDEIIKYMVRVQYSIEQKRQAQEIMQNLQTQSLSKN